MDELKLNTLVAVPAGARGSYTYILLRELLTTGIVYSIFADLVQIRTRIFISKIKERSLENVYIFWYKKVWIYLFMYFHSKDSQDSGEPSGPLEKHLANSSYTKHDNLSILPVCFCFAVLRIRIQIQKCKENRKKFHVLKCWMFS